MNKTLLILFVVTVFLSYILSFNLSYAVLSSDIMKNIPVNGTISPKGCHVVKGTIMNERVNLLETHTCHYDGYKFLITYAPHMGCVGSLGYWDDLENNKSFTFGSPCDVPNFATAKVIGSGYYFSPLQQIKLGVPSNQVVCDYNHQLMTKSNSQTMVCVKPSTAQKLVERGWGSFGSSNMKTDK